MNQWEKTGAVVLLVAAGVAACGEAAPVGGSGGTGSGGEQTDGAPASGGAEAGGAHSGGTSSGGQQASGGSADSNAGAGGEGGMGVGGACADDLSGEDICQAIVENWENCSDDDPAGVYDQCIEEDAWYERLEPCFAQAVVACLAVCGPHCTEMAIVETHPELVNEEVYIACLEFPAPAGVDCSTDNKVEGQQQDCIDRARECSASGGNCIAAVLLGAEFLPDVDACLAGPCDELDQCLHDVAYGPTP